MKKIFLILSLVVSFFTYSFSEKAEIEKINALKKKVISGQNCLKTKLQSSCFQKLIKSDYKVIDSYAYLFNVFSELLTNDFNKKKLTQNQFEGKIMTFSSKCLLKSLGLYRKQVESARKVGEKALSKLRSENRIAQLRGILRLNEDRYKTLQSSLSTRAKSLSSKYLKNSKKEFETILSRLF